MSLIEIILLAIGLSMDSLAVSVTSGILIKGLKFSNVFRIGSILASFQAGMTLIGYLAGMGFRKYIMEFDHWVAFVLLMYLGGKMIYEDLTKKEENEEHDPLCLTTLCGLGIATSIDALAVGISLACLESNIVLDIVTIGVVTFIISASGVYLGNGLGHKMNLKLGVLGGIILMAIGIKILIQHLYFNG
jgi:putative Mn2+ efflux pump MntP